ALKEMPVGSRWAKVIPFHLGYGSKAAGTIKPFSTLIFDVRLVGIS
ncbi:MAG: FKBP-type peptidyl-prolyl cis-trans isomerase, partial [Bacteroidales bacterium]